MSHSPALTFEKVNDVEPDAETDAEDDDLSQSPGSVAARSVLVANLPSITPPNGAEQPHETQDTEPITQSPNHFKISQPDDGSREVVQAELSSSLMDSGSMIRKARSRAAVSKEIAVEAKEVAGTSTHSASDPSPYFGVPEQDDDDDDDNDEAQKEEHVPDIRARGPMLNTSEPRSIKRRFVSRADQYELPEEDPVDGAGEPEKKLRMPKTAFDNHDNENPVNSPQSNMGRPKKRTASKMVTVESENEKEGVQDEIVIAPVSGRSKITPQSAKRAMSSDPTQISTPSSSAWSEKPPKILLSKSRLLPVEKAWMTKNKLFVVDKTPGRDADFVCVVRDQSLPTTVKVLKTLLAGKPVVSDAWITASKRERGLQKVEKYIHSDLVDIDVEPASRRSLFAGKSLFFTTVAAQTWEPDWSDIKELAIDAGAIKIVSGKASTGHREKPREHVLLFGLDKASDDVAEELILKGRTVYNKTMLAQWIIHGKVDLEDDMVILSLPLGEKKDKT